MFSLFKRKKTYCPSMYIGYNGSCKKYNVLCSKTGEGCIAYEETIAGTQDEFEPFKDRAKTRNWTDDTTWRLEIGLLTRCPSNRKRLTLKQIVEQELGTEKNFFETGEKLKTQECNLPDDE